MNPRAPSVVVGLLGVAAGAVGGFAVTVAPPRVTLLLIVVATYLLLVMLVSASGNSRRAAILSIAAVSSTFSWSALDVGGGLSVGEVAPLACVPLAIVGVSDRGDRSVRHRMLLAAPTLVTLGGLLAAARSGGSLAPVVTFALASISLVTALYLLRPTRPEVNTLLRGLVAGVLLSTVLGLLLLREPSGRAVGLTIHPNQFSMAAVMMVPLLWHLVRDGVVRRAAGILGVVLLVAAILESGSRSGLLALAVVAIVWIYREGGFYSMLATLAVGGAALSLAALVLPLREAPAIRRLLDPSATEESDAGRVELLRSEIQAILDGNYLLGTGFVDDRLPHNIVLLLWGGFGLLGLLVFLWLLWTLLQPAVQRRADGLSAMLALGCLGFTAAVTLNNVVGASFFWLTAGIALFRRSGTDRASRDGRAHVLTSTGGPRHRHGGAIDAHAPIGISDNRSGRS